MTTEKKEVVLPSEQRPDAWWWLLAGVIVLIVFLAVTKPTPYRDIVVFVRDGLFVTLWVTVAAYALTLVVGLFGGFGRLSKNRVVYGLTTFYVEIVRGIPLLVQLIWWYYAFPGILRNIGDATGLAMLQNYSPNPYVMAIVGLVFCYGAYMTEIYRAGIQSIPKGQVEAALSLGMSRFQAMRFVVMPQAFRIILPPMGNEFIALLKDSSLVSAVAVADLTRRGREYMAAHFLPVETWVMVALIYLVLTLFSARIVTWIERRTQMVRAH
jgi:polar amino acid transport system permease protein